MIYLANSRTNIPVVAEQWKTMLDDFMFKNLNPYYNKMVAEVNEATIIDKERDLIKSYLESYKSRFSQIVLANEQDLSFFSEENEEQMKNLSKLAKNLLKGIFVRLYKDFTQSEASKGISIAHHFFHKLDIKTCPYCNRQYTFTLDKKNTRTAPEYDHFYDKSHYPILAVSFYNLIPSCHTCNHVKRTKKIKVNPYFEGFESCFRLVDNNGNELSPEIIKKGGGKLTLLEPGASGFTKGKTNADDQTNINALGLIPLYSMHDDYIKEIVEKASAYNNSTIQQALVDAFQSAAYSPQQVFDFVWGKYLEVSQYENRPLSKLTKDILEQLGIQR